MTRLWFALKPRNLRRECANCEPCFPSVAIAAWIREAKSPLLISAELGRDPAEVPGPRGSRAAWWAREGDGAVMANPSKPGPSITCSESRVTERAKLIGSQVADCIRASGHAPRKQAGHMTAPDRSARRHITLASRGPSTQALLGLGRDPANVGPSPLRKALKQPTLRRALHYAFVGLREGAPSLLLDTIRPRTKLAASA
jgi:hypothetical protein